MSNETIFITSALVNIFVILIAARRTETALIGTILINLILISVFGAKLISVFGFTTNAGNVFYACVFLAAHFILERYGRKAGLKTIWMGAVVVTFFTVMSQFAVHFHGQALSADTNDAISKLFASSFRVTIGSILSYIFAQYVNIFLFEWIKAKTRGKYLWLRSNGANIVAQLIDSMLFFSIAFFDLPGSILIQTILIGWLIKSIVVLMGTPFLYLDAQLERKK